MFDCSDTTSQPSGERPDTPNSVNPMTCFAIHHYLSVIKEFVRRSVFTAQDLFHDVLLADRAGE